MTYWYMQLHPNDREWKREEELLEKTGLVGIKSTNLNELDNFKEKLDVGDIVLIRRGNQSIALVEVIGEFEDSSIHTIDSENYISDDDITRLDWFRYRRKVKILSFIDDNIDVSLENKSLIKPRKGKNPYKFIENWHKKISPSFYRNQKGLKINKIYIQKYKIFNEFNLKFDENITIVAGINGSGKTTLLEYIYNFTDFILDKDDDRSLIDFEMDNKHKILAYNSSFEEIGKERTKEISLEAKYFNKHIKYFPTGTDIKDLKVLILDYVKRTMHNEDLKPSEVFDKIRENIDTIFTELNMLIKFDKVDENDEVYFKSKNNESFVIDNLSTGEKTLLAKVLYLYLKEIKDSVILIDEPELSLHPAWQNRVLKLYENFAKENNCQIIIATHSPHIIGSAKNEYIRILTEDGVINDVLAYGRDIEWVLEEVMEASYTREPTIAKKIKECEELLNEDKYDEAEELIDALELLIGKDDKDITSLRTSLEFWRE